MTTTEVTLLIQAITALLVAVVGALQLRIGAKVEEVHLATNSMKDELVASTKVASIAEGRQQVVDEAAVTAGQVAVARAEVKDHPSA